MRARAFAAIAAATAIVALSPIVGSATAARPANRPTYKTVKPSINETFYLAGTNSFLIEGTMRNRHEFRLTALPTKGKGFSSTTYTLEAPQQHGSEGIKASLGQLGSIDVRFVAEKSHREKALLPSCKGDRPIVDEGRFVGQIHFHGEDGYTRVDVHQASAIVQIQPELRCNVKAVKAELKQLIEELEELGEGGKKEEKGKKEAEEPESEVHLAKLKAKLKGRQITFEASRASVREPGKKGFAFTDFSVKAGRHRGRIDEVASTTELFQPGSAFTVPDLTHISREGVVKPPAPFSGRATYRRTSPHSLSWTGDLSVELPGFGNVHLAGPRTRATVCADDGCGAG